jgi:chromatin assembly factor 1 subunit B
MKATPLLVSWHNDNAPIYSVHYDPNGKGRLATAGKYVYSATSTMIPWTNDRVL